MFSLCAHGCDWALVQNFGALGLEWYLAMVKVITQVFAGWPSPRQMHISMLALDINVWVNQQVFILTQVAGIGNNKC